MGAACVVHEYVSVMCRHAQYLHFHYRGTIYSISSHKSVCAGVINVLGHKWRIVWVGVGFLFNIGVHARAVGCNSSAITV